MSGVLRSRGNGGIPNGPLARLASRQYGVVSASQLHQIGIDPRRIQALRRSERLIPLHRGVYAVGHWSLSPWSRANAAVLSCGEGALVSHLSVAYLRRLLPMPYEARDIHVTSSRKIPSRSGILIHQAEPLHPHDTIIFNKIPMTTPARTLLDLAGMKREDCSKDMLVKALNQALVRGHTTVEELNAVMARYPGRRGAKLLRKLMGESGVDESEAERRMRGIIRDFSLPPAEQNVWIQNYKVDFLWREADLIVEIDGYQFHSANPTFISDRRRDRKLLFADYTVLRYTWDDLVDSPATVASEIRKALARAGACDEVPLPA